MCPNHLWRRLRIAVTRLVFAEASSCADLCVMCDRHLALHPFILEIVFSSRRQGSLPYVNSEHTADLYIFSFRANDILSELNTARRSPYLDMDMAHLASTSRSWSPSAVKSDPRYLN